MEGIPTQDIQRYLEDQKNELVSFLARLAQEESPSSHPESQEGVLSLLADSLGTLGFEVEYIPGQASGGHLYAHPLGSHPDTPRQLLLGHSDTVWPLGTLSDMPVLVDDVRVRGPGVYDMKAGLAQMVFALQALYELGLKPEVSPIVFVNSDEEIGSNESTDQITDLARGANRALVLEPSLGPYGKLKTARKGVGKFTIHIRGIPAHAGLEPEKGSSAILELSHLIQRLFALNDPASGVTVNVGLIEGGLRPNVVAPSSKAVVDVRVPTEADARRLEGLIYQLKPDNPKIEYSIEGKIARLPLERTPRNQALWEMAVTAGKALNLPLEQATAGGGSDGNTTSAYTATLDGLGAVGAGAHARHEFVYVDKLVERSALLALLLMSPPV